MFQISKTERQMIYRVYPIEKIPKTVNKHYCPEERKLLMCIKDVNNDAKKILFERYGFEDRA